MKNPNIMNASRCQAFSNRKNLTLISPNTINKHNKANKGNNINKELTLLSIDI